MLVFAEMWCSLLKWFLHYPLPEAAHWLLQSVTLVGNSRTNLRAHTLSIIGTLLVGKVSPHPGGFFALEEMPNKWHTSLQKIEHMEIDNQLLFLLSEWRILYFSLGLIDKLLGRCRERANGEIVSWSKLGDCEFGRILTIFIGSCTEREW